MKPALTRCAHCSRFAVKQTKGAGKRRKYCSKACANAAWERARRPNVPLGRKRPAPLVCKLCKERPCRSLDFTARYCEECAEIRRLAHKREGPSPVTHLPPPQVPSRERALPMLIANARPVYVRDSNGWSVNVAVHDAFYQETARDLRVKRNAAHPDAGGSHRLFLAAQARLEAFVEKEIKWYAPYGLLTPDGQGADYVKPVYRPIVERRSA